MAEPQYHQEHPGWLERVISLVLAGWFFWFFFIENSGNLRGERAVVIPLIPLAVIWFPETAAQLCREKVSAKTASRLGWVGLLLFTLFPMWAAWKVGL